MIKINLVCVGKLKEKFWVDAQNEYIKRLSKFCKFEIIEVAEKNFLPNSEQVLEEEGKDILSKLKGVSIAFDVEGKKISSQEFAKLIESVAMKSSTLTFVIGSSCGLSNAVKTSVDRRLSFGDITLPHNLFRIVALEQIYRAFMINSGSTYHK